MSEALTREWPGQAAAAVFRVRDGADEHLADDGNLDERRAWASVSKMAVAMAFGVEFDWGLHRYNEAIGPRGETIADLLSHSSGAGLEEGDPRAAVGAKRVYSNYGIDLAVSLIVGDNEPAQWLDSRVFSSLGMNETRLEGRPCAGVVGTTRDLVTLGLAWLRPDGLSRETRDLMITPYAPDLAGVVPGFGRFDPCPWGLGPEVRGDKHHWMGDWPADSFGHFGQSGALMLLNAREGLGVVATSTEAFGPWAVSLWPNWTSEMRSLALA